MKAIQWIISALVAVVIIAAAVGGGVYFTRLKSIHSIRKLTDYENYNLYRMDIDYAYDLDRLIDRGITDNQSMINAILAEALPYLPIHMKAPNFGCSAFCTQGTDGHTLMGRNYDFKNDTSAMLVYCTPKDGYASVAFAALDNINANTPDASMAKKLATLTAPFICLDGMNEKGVSIAVLTLDSDPTYQQTGKPMIATTLAIRLVLDRAATTAEAVELLSKYDMFASSGRDYHFYITDASGDGRVLEYDCNDPARPLTIQARMPPRRRIFCLSIRSFTPRIPTLQAGCASTAPTLTTLWFRQTTVITCAAGLTDCIPPPERCFWMSAAALPRQTPPERPMP